jgi:L-gulono-1,4-lactone dehydrogenase
MISNSETISTYAGAWAFRPRHAVECRSIDDVRSVVREATASGLRVRTMGFGNSWAPHLPTPDVCLRLSSLNRIHRIDTDRTTVIVDAGARLGDLSHALAARGLSLPSLSFFPDVTVGGVVATSSHGTSLRWGTLSDFVRSMDVVLPSGEVKTFGPESPWEELCAARVAIGMLGVIVRLELQVVDIPWVRFSELHLRLNDFIAQLPTILAKYEHVWAHWTLVDDQVRVECLETRREQENGFHPYNAVWRPSARLAVHLLNRLGVSTSLLLQLRDRYRWAVRPKKNRQAHSFSKGGDVFMSMQYGVSMPKLEDAVYRIKTSNFANSNPGRIVEFKFLKGNNLSFLGPNADGDAVLFNLWWLVPERSKLTVFDPFEETMRELHAKPHWGKFHRAPDIQYMQSAYPHWAEFDKIRSRYDPNDTFSIFNRERTF